MDDLKGYNNSKVQFSSSSGKVDKLLEILDEEIDIKCNELKVKHDEKLLKQVLVNECLAIPTAIIPRYFFRLTLLHFVLVIIIIEIISLTPFIPLFFSSKY